MSSPVGHRKRARAMVPGKHAEIRSADYLELVEAREVLAAAKNRLRRVTARLQLQIGDAEFGTVMGKVVIMREQARTGGGYVRVNHRDDMRVIGGPK